MTALISCIVPAFNSGKYIIDTLDSIFAQTYPAIEVIVVDDGSTDGTREIVRAYPQKVKLLMQNDSGPAETRNAGLQSAAGSFIAFLDADDLWVPEKLSKQMSHFENDPALDLCVSHAQMFWPKHLEAEVEKYQNYMRSGPIPGYATTTLLAKRYVFDKIGLFDSHYWFGDATDWFLRAKEAGLKFEMVPEVLTLHRMHETNLTRRRSKASRDEFLAIVKASLDRRRGR
jgi:glycosyltransferase involved in cell wall biosynthesis